jgi:CheY-like chemotaxis protein
MVDIRSQPSITQEKDVHVQKKKVLVAEDHEGIAETYKVLLESENYEVTLTENGEECIQKFNQQMSKENKQKETDRNASSDTGSPFDLVILDYHMPLKDGMDVAKHILSVTPYQRILIASSYPRDIIMKSAQDLKGCIELLLKPFDLTDLAAAIEQRTGTQVIGASGSKAQCNSPQIAVEVPMLR